MVRAQQTNPWADRTAAKQTSSIFAVVRYIEIAPKRPWWKDMAGSQFLDRER